MNKSPAFQFYPRDFLASANVKLMTNEQVGIYIKLLCHNWLMGPLPTDQKELSVLADVDSNVMEKLWPGLAKCFEERKRKGSLVLVNPRVERERRRQKSSHKRRVAAGKKGAEERWHGDGNATEKPMAKDSTAFASAIAPASASAEDSTPPDKPKGKEKKAPPKPTPKPRKKDEFAEAFKAAFDKRFEDPYVWQKHDFVHLAKFKKDRTTVGHVQFAALAIWAWDRDEVKRNSAINIAALCNNWSMLSANRVTDVKPGGTAPKLGPKAEIVAAQLKRLKKEGVEINVESILDNSNLTRDYAQAICELDAKAGPG